MRYLRPAAHIPPSMSNMCMIHLNTTHCGLGRVHLGYHTWGQISLGCVVGGAAGLAWLGLTHRVRGQSTRHAHTCSRRGSVCGGLISRIWRTAMSGGCIHLRCGSFSGLIAPRLHVGQILVHGWQWCGGYGIPLTSDAPVARSYPWPSHPHRLFTAPVSRHPPLPLTQVLAPRVFPWIESMRWSKLLHMKNTYGLRDILQHERKASTARRRDHTH